MVEKGRGESRLAIYADRLLYVGVTTTSAIPQCELDELINQ